MVTSTLANELTHTVLGDEIEDLLGHKGVVNQRITALEQPLSFHREQVRITRTCPHQIDGSNQRLIHGSAASKSIKPSRSKGRSSKGAATAGGDNSADIRFGAKTRGNGLA